MNKTIKELAVELTIEITSPPSPQQNKTSAPPTSRKAPYEHSLHPHQLNS